MGEAKSDEDVEGVDKKEHLGSILINGLDISVESDRSIGRNLFQGIADSSLFGGVSDADDCT